MKKVLTLSLLVLTHLSAGRNLNTAELIDQKYPIGEPGLKLTYNLNIQQKEFQAKLPESLTMERNICYNRKLSVHEV